ncbi:MAG: hypothetical protein NG747_03865 [Candidatus Brocadia sp.]|nr:hypothetical protein [Candidatus Brocadia sp.]
MKILFYIEPRIDIGMPYLRAFWLNGFATGIINTLIKSSIAHKFEYCIAINEPLAEKYGKSNFNDNSIRIITQKELFPSFIGDAVDLSIAWYRETYTDEQISYYVSLMTGHFSDFNPDIIITFTPVPYLRKAFPHALILHHEVSFFSKSPYPWVPYFDPSGMYFGKSSFLNKFQNDIKKFPLTVTQQALLNIFKKECQTVIRERSPFAKILIPLKENFDHLILLPLVGDRHYGFEGPCKLNMKNEYQYIVHILEQIPRNIGVVVTYPPQLLNPYGNETIAFLEKQYPHFIYHDEFEKYCSVSQYLLAYVDMVVGLGTSICFQTLMWDNKFIDLGDMSIIADSFDLGAIEEVLKREHQNKDNILYWLLTRYAIQKHYLYDPEWLSRFLVSSLDKFRKGRITLDFYEPIDSDENIFENLMKGIDKNIPCMNPITSYNRLKSFHQTFGNSIDAKYAGLQEARHFEDLIAIGVDMADGGRRDAAHVLFSRMLDRINGVKRTLMNNIAVLHIQEERLEIAEEILTQLMREDCGISDAQENLQKLRIMKNRDK